MIENRENETKNPFIIGILKLGIVDKEVQWGFLFHPNETQEFQT